MRKVFKKNPEALGNDFYELSIAVLLTVVFYFFEKFIQFPLLPHLQYQLKALLCNAIMKLILWNVVKCV